MAGKRKKPAVDRSSKRSPRQRRSGSASRGVAAPPGAIGAAVASDRRDPPARAEPRVLAAIDIGSRALRVAVGEYAGDRPLRRLETLSAPIAIGVDTFARGVIRAVTTQAVVRTLKDFAPVIRSYGVDPADVRAVATTAVRDAGNREVFLEMIEQRSGVHIEVLEAIEETRLVHQLVHHLFDPALLHASTLTLSLGAGSTEVLLEENGEIVLADTRRLGLLRLRHADLSDRGELRTARTQLTKSFGSIGRTHDLTRVGTLICLNGDLHSLVDGMARPRRSRDGALEISRAAFEKLYREVAAARSDAIIKQTRLDHSSVEVARLALEEAAFFVGMARAAKKLILPASSMLDSILLDMRLKRQRAAAGGDGSDSAALRVQAAAWAIARRYRINEPHAARVRDLALQLFDGLRRFTTLSDRSRVLLSAAATLHEVGVFVASHEHEQHTGYLIRATPIMGLSSAEVERVAILAQFHRKALPALDQLGVDELSPSERVEVLKLAALLRMADALDADEKQRVERVQVEMSAERLDLRAETRSGDREDFAFIERSFREKAVLFQELFGVETRLTEVLAK